MVVIGIIAAMLVVLIPALSSMSRSSGRKAAVSNLLGVFEQARAQSIKDGQATYVVFATFSNASQSTLDRYNFKSFAIFADDPATPAAPKQVSNWKTLPAGISLRAASLTGLPDPSDAAKFSPPLGIVFSPETSAAAAFRCIKYTSTGEVEQPASNVSLSVFEGYVSGDATAATEVVTSAKNPSGQPAAVESIKIARLTGRAERSW